MNEVTNKLNAPSGVARVLYNGREFKFVHDDPKDHIFAILRDSRSFYEADLLSQLAGLIPRGSTVIDVGANIGNHAVFFAGVLGCRVIAFEANAKAAALLTQNVGLNGLTNLIDVRECAVGADNRKGRVTGLQAHNLGTASITNDPSGDVEIVPLDQLEIDGAVSLLKIDVEGMEFDVLAGARALVKRHRPLLSIEAPLAEDFRRIALEIEPLGYVPIGSFNYTPTHIFMVPAEDGKNAITPESISHRLSLQYIDTMSRTARVDRQLSNLGSQVAQIVTREKTALSRIETTEAGQSQLAEQLKHVRSEQIAGTASTSEKLSELRHSVQAAASQIDSIIPTVGKLQAGLTELHAQGDKHTARHEASFDGMRNLLSRLDERQTAARNDTGQQISAALARMVDLSTLIRSGDEKREAIRQQSSAIEQRLQMILEANEARALDFDRKFMALEGAIAARGREGKASLDAIAAALDGQKGQFDERMTALETTAGRIVEDRALLLKDVSEVVAVQARAMNKRIEGLDAALSLLASVPDDVTTLRDAVSTAFATQEKDRSALINHVRLTASERSDAVDARFAAVDTAISKLANVPIEISALRGVLDQIAARTEDDRASIADHIRLAVAEWSDAHETRFAAVDTAYSNLASIPADVSALRELLDQVSNKIGTIDQKNLDATLPELTQLRSMLGALAPRIANVEGALCGLSDGVMRVEAAARQQADLQIELQMIGSTDADAKLGALEVRLTTTLERRLDARLAEVIERRLSELTTRMTDTVGRELADRRLTEEITASTGSVDIGKALAVLGVPSDPKEVSKADAKQVALTASAAAAPPQRDVWFVKGHTPKVPAASKDNRHPAAAVPASGPPLVEIDYSGSWDKKGWAQGNSVLEANGRITAKTGCPRLGFVGPAIAFEGGGLVEFEIDIRDGTGTQVSPVLKMQTESDFAFGHDYTLKDGVTIIRAFAPQRTKRIKFYVVMLDAPAGASFRIARLVARRISADAHLAGVKQRVGEPVYASMATIPSRREMLRDCVNSLLVQCDRVRVFLNNYPDVPDFLNHPRVEIRRSQDWDDRGDAGKFFWIDRDRQDGGYRLIVDDDLVFPPDFVDVMTSKVAATARKGIFSLHGILLRQPISRFYDRSSRATTFHFAGPLAVDRSVHIGGTGVMCFHASALDLRLDDFLYCNSADLWIAKYAQKNELPMLTPARPRNWVRENSLQDPVQTIYHQSLQRTKSRFDSSLVQDAVLRHGWPLTLKTSGRSKVAIAMPVRNAQTFAAALADWTAQARSVAAATEFVVFIAFDGKNQELATSIAALTIPHETHLIDLATDGIDLMSEITTLHARLHIDATFVLPDTARISRRTATATAAGKERLAAASPQTVGAHQVTVWCGATSGSELAVALASGPTGHDGLMRFLGADFVIEVDAGGGDTPSAIAGRPIPNALAIGLRRAADPVRALSTARPYTANSVFQRIAVLNLDRRPDRWQSVSARLERAGIVAERFSAVDGKTPSVAEEYSAYAAKPLHTVAADLPKISYSADLYMNYASQMARVAHLEAQSKKKAIASAGAWGYLRSYETILEQSLARQDETLLVFDDDVVLHKDFKRLFDQAISELPPDWLIVQFGTLQYNWNQPWAQSRTPMLYQTNGAAIGSHAVGMRFDILPFLLDHTKRMDLPYDVGPLSAATRAFPDRCFVITPNLAIQSLEASDIGTSDFQKGRTVEEIAAVYRWKLLDYDF